MASSGSPAADAVLVVHGLFVVFVVAGLVLILAGGALGWRWVRSPPFRVAHLVAIAVVAVQAWVGATCPLTTLENDLRRGAGGRGYEGGFIAHWVERLLYHDAPAWVFTACYTAFAAAVVAAWVLVRPRPLRPARGPRR